MNVTLDGPERFYDYRWLNEIDPNSRSDALLTTMPLDGWRLCQFELLRSLGMQWLALHEAAHWFAGHLGFLEAGRSAPDSDLHLQFSDPETGMGAGESAPSMDDVLAKALKAHKAKRRLPVARARRCMEFQADYLGFLLLAHLQGSWTEGLTNAFTRYERRMTTLDLPDWFSPIVHLDPPQRTRAMIVAAGAIVLLIERAAQMNGRSQAYPVPLARLLNVQMAAVAASELAVFHDDDVFLRGADADRPEFRHFIGTALGRSMFDFDVLSQLLGLSPFIGKTDGGSLEALALTRDLQRFFDAKLDPKTLETDAGREVFALRADNGRVHELCESYALVGLDHATPKALS